MPCSKSSNKRDGKPRKKKTRKTFDELMELMQNHPEYKLLNLKKTCSLTEFDVYRTFHQYDNPPPGVGKGRTNHKTWQLREVPFKEKMEIAVNIMDADDKTKKMFALCDSATNPLGKHVLSPEYRNFNLSEFSPKR